MVVNPYASICNTFIHEDGNLSGQVVTDSNGYKERWGINSQFWPTVDIESLTFQDAVKLARTQIWPAGLDNVPSQILANMVFDFGFNDGMEKSIKIFQGVLCVDQDGVIGPKTLNAISQTKVTTACLAELLASAYKAAYTATGNPDLKGLLARVDENTLSAGW